MAARHLLRRSTDDQETKDMGNRDRPKKEPKKPNQPKKP
jgi:hypothetical protein